LFQEFLRDAPWDPSVDLDSCNNEDNQWIDAVADIKPIERQKAFDRIGNYKHTVTAPQR
jgi:hypothetical protein